MSRTVRGGWPGALTVALALCLGCRPAGPPPPKTYPVQGRVVFKDGQPLAGGAVEFRQPDPAAPISTGEVGPDGTFALSCIVGNKKVDGAVPGTFQVTVMPQQGADQSGGRPIQVTKSYIVKEGDRNDFTITIDRPKK
jgi:hypothetical protein